MKILVIGGAGFIGCNVVDYYARRGHSVTLFDNFSRRGTLVNLAWLQGRHGSSIRVVQGDVRIDTGKLAEEVGGADVVFHLASQVAVTTSIASPREDFEINALGTFNVCEAVRSSGRSSKAPVLVYASTNKVYGSMGNVAVVKRNCRYELRDHPGGISEDQPLDFHSPYGCSKGAGDQYVRDYARIYGLKTVVFRQSCIYGIRQFGVEDQGWVAHFVISALFDRPITIYGDGMQVRDLLYISDLLDAYDKAIKNIKTTAGKIYNIGGGPRFQMSLLELIAFLEETLGRRVKYSFSDWRPGDQPVFICDVSRAERDFGWRPRTSPKVGIRRLISWVRKNERTFRAVFGY